MQKEEVLHRDIKDENILLNEKTNQVFYYVTVQYYVIVYDSLMITYHFDMAQ